MKKKSEICSECNKERERCRAASVRQVDDRPEIEWVCPKCWRDLEYDRYLYDHVSTKNQDQEC